MWTFESKDFKAKWMWEGPLIPSQTAELLQTHHLDGWFPRETSHSQPDNRTLTTHHLDGPGQIRPSTGTKLAWSNKLLETSISVWCMNIKQCWGWKQYVKWQVLGNKQKAGSRPGQGAKILVKDNSSWRNDSRFEDSRFDLKK